MGNRTRATLTMAAIAGGSIVLPGCGTAPSATARSVQAGVLVQRGQAAQARGALATAVGDYRKALALESHDAGALSGLGAVALLRGNRASAQHEFAAAVAADPEDVGALLNLAILVTTTNPRGAEALYRQAVSVSPRDPVLRRHLGSVLRTLGQTVEGDYELAVATALERHQPLPLAPSSSSTTTTSSVSR
jgi:Flp pilus assembly protein TadD